MAEIVVVRNLSKRYGAFQALHDVSFTLRQGEVVGFLGPNGAGKSTTMKVLTGYVEPSGGSAVIAGHDVAREPLACRAAIGYLPEELPLYLDMTVTAYLDHVARLKGVSASQRRREVVEAIEAAWLGDNAKRTIRTLSKGNRQRVGVAQALLGKPPLLILDEPTSGLDPSQVANFRELVRSLARRHTMVLSTHIMGEVEAVCDRVVVVHRGRVVADEPVSALQARAASLTRLLVRLRASDTGAFSTALTSVRDVRVVAQVAADAVRIDAPPEQRMAVVALAEANGGLRELIEERRSLEEVFCDLIA